MSQVYVSVDIETSGPFPPKYSMLSLGAVAFRNKDKYEEIGSYYTELKPISHNMLDLTREIHGFTLEGLTKTGVEPKVAMQDFCNWVEVFKTPLLVAAPVRWDGMFVCYYFLEYVGHDPFGHNGIDMRSYWMALNNEHYRVSKNQIKKRLGLGHLKHTHNALDDAREQAQMFHAMMRYKEHQQTNLSLLSSMRLI